MNDGAAASPPFSRFSDNTNPDAQDNDVERRIVAAK